MVNILKELEKHRASKNKIYKKTYYETQLENVNKFEKIKDKKIYIDTIDFSHLIEKDSDANLIKQLYVFREMPFKEEKENYDEDDKNIEEDFLIINYNLEGKEISRKVDIEKVADHFIENNHFSTIYEMRTEKILLYDNKIFSGGAKHLIKSECEKLLTSYSKKNVVEEIYDKVKRKTAIKKEEFEKTDLYLIPLDNGCYNIKTKKLEEHSPKNNFTFYSPVKYNLEARCPNWFKFIEEALYPEDLQVIKQWFGFNLFRQYFIKKAMILLGAKDTGKTILLDTLISFVGEMNKCGLSLQKISSGSDFTKFALRNKLSNIYDDLSSADINDGGAFKIATGGGFISAEEKFGDCVQFKSYAANTLAGNKSPSVKDNDDDAYFSRFIPIKFDNVPENKDPFLRDKLQTEEELSGILNWALEGLHEILEKGNFSFNKTDEEIKNIMQMSGDILIQFGSEVLEQSGEQISKDKMYEIFCFWANKNKKPILSKEQLGRRLNMKITYLVAKRNKKGRFWDNVCVNPKWLEENNKLGGFENLKGNEDTLDTLYNFICLKKNKSNNDKNKGSKNNIYKVKKSVESVKDSFEELYTNNDNLSEEDKKKAKEIFNKK